MKLSKINENELQFCIGSDILLVRNTDMKQVKIRLTKIRDNKIYGVGHNGKDIIQYEMPLIPEINHSEIYKIVK